MMADARKGTMKRLIPLALLAVGLPAFAGQVFYVDANNGSDTNPGTQSAPFASIGRCTMQAKSGDTCSVSHGTYITPASVQTGATILCPGRDCSISGGIDLRGRSRVIVEGFGFVGSGTVVPWGGSSAGNVFRNVTIIGAKVQTAGGTGNVMEDFFVYMPTDKVSSSNPLSAFQLGANATAANPEKNTIIRRGTVRGGWNGIETGNCSGCTFDAVFQTGSKNHGWSMGGGVTSLTIKNSAIVATSGFAEPYPEVLGTVKGLTLLNDFIVPGYLLPAIGHEGALSGKVTIRNCVIYNAGKGSTEIGGGINNSNGASVTWDFDYNVYAGPGAQRFLDSRNGDAYLTLAGWQALGFDRHSITMPGDPWAGSGPIWGGMVQGTSSPGSFTTHSEWSEGIVSGDSLECDWDGTARAVTSSSGGVVKFSPSLAKSPVQNRWFLSWGKAVSTAKAWVPPAGSPLIDAGDPALCGHIAVNACDIGPGER